MSIHTTHVLFKSSAVGGNLALPLSLLASFPPSFTPKAAVVSYLTHFDIAGTLGTTAVRAQPRQHGPHNSFYRRHCTSDTTSPSAPAPMSQRVPQQPLHCLFSPWQYYYKYNIPFALPLLSPLPLPPSPPHTHTRTRTHTSPVCRSLVPRENTTTRRFTFGPHGTETQMNSQFGWNRNGSGRGGGGEGGGGRMN